MARRSIDAAVSEELAAASIVQKDRELARLRGEVEELRGRYKAALREIDHAHKAAELHATLAGLKPRKMKSAKPGSPSRATAVLVLSDWHIEERVKPESVNFLNDYSLDIARTRVATIFDAACKLLEHERALTKIDHIVIAALGDFISGHIHEELLETCELPPLSAAREAGELLLGGIERMASQFKQVDIVTSHGNHGRTTPKIRVATGHDHSFEHNLYKWLERTTRDAANVRWQISDAYLNYMDIQGYTVRFHHGDAVSYSSGVGGLTIPMNKAKANWDRSRHSDLDICGHFHTWLYMPYKFLVNGSLIGMSPFAVRIRAEYQPPTQSLLIIDGKHGVTKALQLFADRDVRRGALCESTSQAP